MKHRYLSFLFSFLLFFLGCQPKTEEAAPSAPEEIRPATIAGKVLLPAGAPLAPGALTVASSWGKSAVANAVYSLDVLGKFSTVFATDPAGEIVLMRYNYPGQPDYDLSPQSTAVALLMTSPTMHALTDLGAITYRREAAAYNNLSLRNIGVHNRELNGITWDNYTARSQAILRTVGQAKETQFTTGLPTALNVDVDYHIAGPFYLNAAVSQGLRGRNAIGMRQFSYAAFSPRLETRWVDIAAGISQTNDYQLLAYNLLVRLGPLTVGTNNLLGLLADSNPYGANAYAEVSLLTWANKRPKTKMKRERPKRMPRTT